MYLKLSSSALSLFNRGGLFWVCVRVFECIRIVGDCFPPFFSTTPGRYGFLLRVKAMGMGSSIDRERKIAAYWARLMDEASSYDDDNEYDD